MRKNCTVILLIVVSFSLVHVCSALADMILQDQLSGGYQINAFSPIGQSFTAEDERIESIGVSLSDMNSFTAPDSFNVTVELYEGKGFEGSSLGTSTMSLNDGISTGSYDYDSGEFFVNFQNFDFSDVELIVGESYSFKLIDPTPRWGVGINQHSYADDYLSPIPGRVDYEGGDAYASFEDGLSVWETSDLTFQILPRDTEPEGDLYGLFIGTNYYWDDIDSLWKSSDFKGGDTAEMLRDSFLKIPNFEEINTTVISELSISDVQIKEEIDKIKEKMEPGDKFFLYIGGHGGSESSNGGESTISGLSPGDEYIFTGWNPINESWTLTDDELYSYLVGIDDDIEKWVFIDACHSGGFWGNDSSNDIGDLEKINNIGFMSSAWENTNSLYSKDTGISLFAYALDSFLNNEDFTEDFTEEITFYTFANYLVNYLDYDSWMIGMVMQEMGIGDEHILSKDMWNIMISESDDFKGVLYANPNAPVPEPSTIILMGIGLLGLVAIKSRKQKS